MTQENFSPSDQSFIQTPGPQKEKRKLSPATFAIIFLAILVVVGGGYWVWNKFLSEQAQIDRQTQEQYEKYLSWQEQYEEAMKNDTYGGATPQETLDMFIEALKQEDVELASKYFSLDTNEQEYNRENYLTRNKVYSALVSAREKNNLENLVGVISQAISDKEAGFSEKSAWFITYSKDNPQEIEADIHLIFNEYSNVWKIESL